MVTFSQMILFAYGADQKDGMIYKNTANKGGVLGALLPHFLGPPRRLELGLNGALKSPRAKRRLDWVSHKVARNITLVQLA